jgi:hypothetical protein
MLRTNSKHGAARAGIVALQRDRSSRTRGECKVYRIMQTVGGKLTGGYTVIARRR